MKPEQALAAFPGLADVTVIEHGADQDDQCLIAYVVPSGPGLDVPELHAYARKSLPNGSMPAAIMVVDEIPVTAAGTVDAAALPVPDLSGLLPYLAPATLRQEILCELFAEVLGAARCGTKQRLLRPRRPLGRGNGAGRAHQHCSRRPDNDGRPVQGAHGGDMDRRLDQMADARK